MIEWRRLTEQSQWRQQLDIDTIYQTVVADVSCTTEEPADKK